MLIIISTITGCISTSAVASVVGISIEILSSEIGVHICVVTAGIKKYKSTHRILSSKSRNKDYNVMVDGKNFFVQLITNDIRTYDNI